MTEPKSKQKPGPEPDRLKLDGDWQERVAQALKKPRPEGGWPKPESRYKPRKKKASKP